MPVNGFNNGFSPAFGANRRGFLQLSIGETTYEDGDIVSAVPWIACRCLAAQGICFAPAVGERQFARLNGAGLYDVDDVAQDYLEATAQFRFERLSANEAKIVRLSDLNEIRFESNKPFVQHDGKTVGMDIVRHLSHQTKTLRGPGMRGMPIFGQLGQEVWYGGKKTIDNTRLDTIWTAIQTKTAFLESTSVNGATFSNTRKSLVIAVNDFDYETASELTTSLDDETDPEDIIKIKKRKHHIEWRGLRDVVESDVLNKQTDVRIDGIRKHVRSEIQLTKII